MAGMVYWNCRELNIVELSELVTDWRVMANEVTVVPENNPKGSPETSIASSVVPYDRDDERALFFGYRCSGLSIRETLHVIERSKAWLSEQRHDPVFVDLEGRIPEFRKTLSKEYIEIEFHRNFRLCLLKDHQIIKRSLGMEKDENNEVVPLTNKDQEYLLKLRSQYSPAQIQVLEQVVSGKEDGFNWAKFVSQHPDIITLSRTDSVTMIRDKNEHSS